MISLLGSNSLWDPLNKSVLCNSEQKYNFFHCNHKVIEVVNENVDVFCKIPVPLELQEKSEISLQFKIKNCDGSKVNDLTTYVSSIQKEPNSKQNQKYYIN